VGVGAFTTTTGTETDATLTDTTGECFDVGTGVGGGVALGVGLGVGLGVATALGAGVGGGVALGVGLGVATALGAGVGAALGAALGAGLGGGGGGGGELLLKSLEIDIKSFLFVIVFSFSTIAKCGFDPWCLYFELSLFVILTSNTSSWWC